MGKVILLTGIPGAGKSFFVKNYLETHPNETHIVCSADHHFEGLAKQKRTELEIAGDLEGAKAVPNYLFDYMQLRTAHMTCQQKCVQAMEAGVDIIFVDNTNITNKERQFYINSAMSHEYDVEIKAFPKDEEMIKLASSRNQHGVPEDKIRQRALAQDLDAGYYKVSSDPSDPLGRKYLTTKVLENIQFLKQKPSLDDISFDIAKLKEKTQGIKIEYPETRTPEIAEALDDLTGALDVAQHHIEDIKGKLGER